MTILATKLLKSRYSDDSLAGANQTEHLVNELGRKIVAREISVGSAIPSQSSLSEQYSVSRIVVREATQVLRAKGMVYSRMSKGILVAPEQDWNLFDKDILNWLISTNYSQVLCDEFSQFRLATQPSSAFNMAQSASVENKGELSRLVEHYGRCLHLPTVRGQCDLEIQTHIFASSSNRFHRHLIPFLTTAWAYTQQSNLSKACVGKPSSLSLYQKLEHSIVDNLPSEASRIMRQLVQNQIFSCA